MEKKKLTELLAAIFIAVVFLSSYAAFGANSGGAGAKTSTTTIPGTIQVHGSASASIVSYGTVLDANVSCANAGAVASSLNTFLSALERNGSISNFYSPEDSEVLLELGNYTAAEAYGALAARLGRNASCTSFSATQATVQLPSSMNVTYGTGSVRITIPPGLRNYTRQVRLSGAMGSGVNVSVYALVTNNGTIFNSQIVVTLKNA